MKKFSPAARLALAYVYATGDRPAHIRMATHRVLWNTTDFVCDVDERIRTGRMYYFTDPEAEQAAKAHPLGRAHDHLARLGWRPEAGRRRTSHYVRYHHPDNRGYAVAYRHGGGSITTPVYSEGGTFLRNEIVRFEDKDI